MVGLKGRQYQSGTFQRQQGNNSHDDGRFLTCVGFCCVVCSVMSGGGRFGEQKKKLNQCGVYCVSVHNSYVKN